MQFPKPVILTDVATRRVLDQPGQVKLQFADKETFEILQPFAISQNDAEELVVKLCLALAQLGNEKAKEIIESHFTVE
jgi:hypothetical protein